MMMNITSTTMLWIDEILFKYDDLEYDYISHLVCGKTGCNLQ